MARSTGGQDRPRPGAAVVRDRELTTFRISAVASDSALTRVVVTLGSRGVRIRELHCNTVPGSGIRIRILVETMAGRANRIAAALNRVVEVTEVQIVESSHRELGMGTAGVTAAVVACSCTAAMNK